MKLRAFAKVNLGLDVVKKLENGYHELNSVFVPIALHDQILIYPSEAMMFKCHPDFRIAPEKNTLLKMVEVCRAQFNFSQNFNITLYKNIPSQAGLGGGSADAAALLNYLDRFFKWHLSPQAKINLALKVGADVPFCLFNTPAVVTGIGDQLEFFEFEPNFGLVLVQPKKGVSTQKAFEGLDIPNLIHPPILEIKEALVNEAYERFIKSLDNSLQAKACVLVPEIKDIQQKLLDLGCDKAVMTGSGSVVMGFSQSDEILEACVKAFKSKVRFVRKTKVMRRVDLNLLK